MTVSTLVRVSVIQKLVPLIDPAGCQFPLGSIEFWTYFLRQNILRIVGYNDLTDEIREFASDEVLRSAEQPDVKFVTTSLRVSLLQAGALHMVPSQVFRGLTTEVLVAATTGTRRGMARH